MNLTEIIFLAIEQEESGRNFCE